MGIFKEAKEVFIPDDINLEKMLSLLSPENINKLVKQYNEETKQYNGLENKCVEEETSMKSEVDEGKETAQQAYDICSANLKKAHAENVFLTVQERTVGSYKKLVASLANSSLELIMLLSPIGSIFPKDNKILLLSVYNDNTLIATAKFTDQAEVTDTDKQINWSRVMGKINNFTDGIFSDAGYVNSEEYTIPVSEQSAEKLDRDIKQNVENLVSALMNYKNSFSDNDQVPKYTLARLDANYEMAFLVANNLDEGAANRLAAELNSLVKKGDSIKYEVWEDN